ncbi:16683_t:CDS:2, partial [Racocetra persica]
TIEDNISTTIEEFNSFSISEASEEYKEIWKMINYMYRQISKQMKYIEQVTEALVDHKLHIEALQRKSFGIPKKINYLEKTVKQLIDTINKHNQYIEDLEQENRNLKRKLSDLQKDHYQT